MQSESRTRPLAAIVAAGALFFFAVVSYPMFAGTVDLRQDLSTFHLPARWFYQQCLHHGDSFLWMPGMFCGFYLHGIGEVGMCHPLHLLLYGTLPFTVAYNLEGLLAYAFLFAGMYLLLRRWTLPAFAALFGAFVFTWCGFCKDEFMHMTAIVAHLPWLLLAIDTALNQPTPRKAAGASLAITALTASQLLLGHPQMVYLTVIVEALYVLYRLRSIRSRKILVMLVVAKLLGLAIGAIQILPTLDAAAHSYRADPSFAFRMGWSLRPLMLIQWFSPYVFEQRGAQEIAPYMGAAAAVLWVYALLRYRDLGTYRPLVAAATGLAVIGVVLALGQYGYVYRAWALLPIVRSFRAAQRHLFWLHFATAIVTAVACADLFARLRDNNRMPWPRAAVLALPFLASLVVAAAAIASRGRPEPPFVFASTRNILMGAALFAVATILVIAAARGRRFALPALLAFTIADLALYGLRHPEWERFDAFVNRIEVPPPSPGFRADPDLRPLYAHSCATLKGVSVPQGYCGLIPESRLDYYNQTAALRLAGVRWRKARYGAIPELTQAAREGKAWYEVSDPMPRARLVTQTQVSANPHDDIERIDIATTALIAAPLDLPQGTPGRASIVDDRPGLIRIAVDAPTRQLLIVNERYHEGRTARAEGAACNVVPAYGDFIGVIIEPGAHEVTLRFQPRSFTLGLWITIAALAVAVAYHVALRLRSRRRALWNAPSVRRFG